MVAGAHSTTCDCSQPHSPPPHSMAVTTTCQLQTTNCLITLQVSIVFYDVFPFLRYKAIHIYKEECDYMGHSQIAV